MMTSRYTAPACIVFASLLLAGCAATVPPAAHETSTPSTSTASTAAAPVSTLTDAERVTKAEAAVKAELPNAPIWKGMTFKSGSL